MPTDGSPEIDDPLGQLVDLDGVAAAVASVRAAVDRLRAHRVMRRAGETVTAESLRRGAVAAASIETGAELSAVRDQELLESAYGSPAPAEPTEPPEPRIDPGIDRGVDIAAAVRGAGRAYGELGALRDTWVRSPLQVLARVHLLAARDILAPELLGRPRADTQRLLPGPYDHLLGAAPTAAEAAERLDGLVWLLGATRAPALVVSAVVHAEIASLRPFAWGNHIVGMAAQRLVLIDSGLDPRSHAVVEVGHRAVSGAYGSALSAYSSGRPGDVGAWIRHCGDAVVAGAVEGLAICESLGR